MILVEKRNIFRKRNLDLKRGWKERRRRKSRQFRHSALNVRQHRKELLVSDLVDEALHNHKSNWSSGISSSQRRRRAMIFQQTDATGESETELNSVILNRTVEDKVTFQLETDSHHLNEWDVPYELSVQSTVKVNTEIVSEKETLQDTIIFRDANKSKDLTLNGSDMLLLQILKSLQNENDWVSVATIPPTMLMSIESVMFLLITL